MLPHETMRKMSNAIRFLSIDMIQTANSGHPGMPMGMADIATVLFTNHLRFNPKDPTWPGRDRFILSNGHGSALLYSLLHLTGYREMENIEQLKNFRKLGYHTAGHPEIDHNIGIETTTGPLGQGIATATGMALAERIMNSQFGDDLVDSHTYVFAGDGCLMEGVALEAISFAGHMKLSKLIVFFDDNGITIDGRTDISTSDNIPDRFRACGWNVIENIDGHNFDAIDNAIKKAKQSDKPSLLCCKTIIGFGSPNKAGSSKVHGSPLGETEIEETKKALNWNYQPFEIPKEILDEWKISGKRSEPEYQTWQHSLNNHNNKEEFIRRISGDLLSNFESYVKALINEQAKQKPTIATRKASQMVLNELFKKMPELVGGSADLTGSNNTLAKGMEVITHENGYSGNYINYGIREHAMAAIANGMRIYGGIIPYVGTFFCFSDYLRPALRLSALMQQKVIYVMTHDSIGLGEDGPTHQPIEHLASLRAMPNVKVIRPCDIIETANAWINAIKHNGPTVIVLSRQELPTITTPSFSDYKQLSTIVPGVYVVHKDSNDNSEANMAADSTDITIIATGSEVSTGLEVAKKLRAINTSPNIVDIQVLSIPCHEDINPIDLQNKLMNHNPKSNKLVVSTEAASTFGWERIIGCNGISFGIDSFGASAPATDLYKHFGLDAESVTNKIINKLNNSKNGE